MKLWLKLHDRIFWLEMGVGVVDVLIVAMVFAAVIQAAS